jgi:hypothetical protein
MTMKVPHLSRRKANMSALLSKLALLQEAQRARGAVQALLGAEVSSDDVAHQECIP